MAIPVLFWAAAGALTFVAGCTFDPIGAYISDSGVNPDANPESGMDATAVDALESDAETDAGVLADAAPTDVYLAPQPILPAQDSTLPPSKAFLLWSPASLVGKAITRYEVCTATAAFDSDACPNLIAVPDRYHALNPLKSSAEYFWKVRGCDDQSDCTEYAGGRFLTDDSLITRVTFDDDPFTDEPDACDDASANAICDVSDNNYIGVAHGYDTPQERAGARVTGAGILGAALLLDGLNDYVTFGNLGIFESMRQLTLVARVRHRASPPAGTIISKGPLDNPSYAITALESGYRFIVQRRNGLQTVAAPFPLESSAHHLIAVTGTAAQSLSVNGQTLTSTTASEAGIAPSDGALCIGASCGPGTRENFSGIEIDEAELYDAAFTPELIRNEYCASQALRNVQPLDPVCLE